MAVTDAPKIVTGRFDVDDAFTLQRYQATEGYEALRSALQVEPTAVTDIVKAANLTGRGGAGFPAGNKWGFLPPDVFPRYLVINGDESEPGTCKDRPLMERDPHQVIEGIIICAYAVNADRAFLYVRGEMALAQERLAQALNEAYDAGFLGRNILGSGFDLDIVLHWGAGAYIVGEETALIESLEGNRGMPRIKPPYFPAARGLYQQPTVVNNIETVANLPWIIRNGGEAFAALGGGRATGTRMFCVSGHVKRPGNYEVEQFKTTFHDLFYAPVYGGGIRSDHQLKMFIPGGASAPWFYPEQVEMALDSDEVGANGSMLGSGAIVVMDETTCAVRAAWRLVRFFAHESCGKCTPCREGGAWLEKILHRIENGYGREDDLELLLDVGDNISPGPFPHPPGNGEEPVRFPYKQTTICPLGPSAVSPTFSSIWRFRDEYLTHIKDGACPYG
jgi:NADH-quinone oxidoreductase subunit F